MAVPDSIEEVALWVAYRAAPNDTNRNALVVHYLPLTEKAAVSVMKRGAAGEKAELASYAAFGLIWAVGHYHPDSEDRTSFERYVWPRLVGSIIDELRVASPVSRNVIRNNKRLRTARRQLAEAGVADTDEALAKMMGVTVRRAHELVREMASTGDVESLDAPLRVRDAAIDELSLADMLADTGPDPSELVDATARLEALSQAVDRLTGRESLIIQLHDVEGLTLATIGVRLGVSESRVSQIHTKAVNHLRRIVRR